MDRTEWLEARQKGITGTDISAIAGLNPWVSPLDVWYEKRGLVEPVAENDAMKWGTLQEPLIADFFAEKHGVTLTSPGLMIHPEKSFVIGTPDRLIDGKTEGLEIKTGSGRTAQAWGEQGTNQIPDHYYAQCQWYMGIVGYPVWHVAVKLDSADYREYVVNADERVINRLQEIAAEFWEKNVIGGETPAPKEGGKFGSRYLEKLKDDGVMLAFTEDGLQAAREYAEYDRLTKEYEAKKQLARAKLETLIGEASGVEGDGYKITWKQSKARESVDWEAFARTHINPVAFSQEIKKFTSTKPGPRVFRFRGVDNGEL